MKSRSRLIRVGAPIIALLIAISLSAGCSSKSAAVKESAIPKTHEAAVAELMQGNARFVEGKLSDKGDTNATLSDLSNNGQHPFATVLTCSDSRVSPEIIFDQGLGRLFVIKDAGNVTDAVQTGSVEYGVEHLNTPMLIVLSHEKCGAVKATVEGAEATPNIEEIVKKIEPSYEKIVAHNKGIKAEEISALVENENALNTVAELMKSPAIKHKVDSGELKVVTAKYDLDTGKVVFFK